MSAAPVADDANHRHFYPMFAAMSRNKLQKFAEMEAFPNVFQYPYAVLQAGGGCPLKGCWREEAFGGEKRPIVLELGCGRGEYTVGLGALHPDKLFIGIDVKGARMWAGARQANKAGMRNVAFLRTDIELLTHFFAPGEVDEIWITFPDPQMNKVNKRLTATRFMKIYSQILPPAGGVIHLKTDSPFLFTYTREMIRENSLPTEVCTADLYAAAIDPNLSEAQAIHTHYEQQWIDRGLTIKYLRFRCLPREAWAEPDVEIERDTYRSYNRGQLSALDKRKGENLIVG